MKRASRGATRALTAPIIAGGWRPEAADSTPPPHEWRRDQLLKIATVDYYMSLELLPGEAMSEAEIDTLMGMAREWEAARANPLRVRTPSQGPRA